LALTTKVGLKLGEHTKHIQEALAGRCAGVNRPLGGFQDGPLQFADAARETINAGNQRNVAEVQKLQNGAESLTAFGRVAAPLLRTDDLTRGPRSAALPASAFAEAFAMLSTQAVSEDCVTYDREGDAKRRSAPARRLDRRYVDLFHLHHRLERAFGHLGISIGDCLDRRDLP
jgi:hypothetical protein